MTGPRQLWELCQITFPCLAKLALQSAANDFRSPHHHSKTYLLVGFITIIKPHIFSIHLLARVSSLAWVMNGAAMASLYFFLMNYLLSLDKWSYPKLNRLIFVEVVFVAGSGPDLWPVLSVHLGNIWHEMLLNQKQRKSGRVFTSSGWTYPPLLC